jgi:BRCT domain type II-containing protein
MKTLAAISAASILAIAAVAQAQQAPSTNNPNPSAATSTGTSTSQSEMNRGVPGVNVDVGRNAPNNVISADVDRNTDVRNVTGSDRADRNRTDSWTADGMRAPRADRN